VNPPAHCWAAAVDLVTAKTVLVLLLDGLSNNAQTPLQMVAFVSFNVGVVLTVKCVASVTDVTLVLPANEPLPEYTFTIVPTLTVVGVDKVISAVPVELATTFGKVGL
jgi:hypothetical protein